ncbi:hypothetical protein ABIF65_007689 [Bradyrhizobium japonicum]|uniref:hypothetical protein n=1 Tax=Bradyrhizobium liaoningense TaxID=43992 RepID=UPI001BA4430D|nr:hypothetical protein [Bradyrhizobium liaoningense]MBR1067470.1 hypothetical protein [Bradyrhizobium liaoningense]
MEYPMRAKYENLTACCDGQITVEKLERFELAMREFKEFMGLAKQMFAPPSKEMLERRAAEDAARGHLTG